jgi:HD-like signal output (HDOD) protein
MARFVDRVRRDCQCAIGVLVTSHWGMPPSVVEAIADHNRSEPASDVGKLVRAARIAIAARGDERPETMTALAALGVDARVALETAASLCV